MQRYIVNLKGRLASVTHGVADQNVGAPPVPRGEDSASTTDAMALEGLHQAIADFAGMLRVQRARLVGEIAQTSVELAVQIAERLLGIEIAANRQRLDQIVLTSLERVQVSASITVKTNPQDLALLQQQISGNAVPPRSLELLAFQPDESCPRGKLKLETDELFIEWDTQRGLAEIRNVLLEEVYSEATNQ